VVSKEEVAAGRKGSGGTWESTSRNVGLAGPAPQNGRWSNTGKKQAGPPVVGLSGCNLVVLKSALPQENCKIQAPFSATPVRVVQGAWVLV
jgi:hypothetical protein